MHNQRSAHPYASQHFCEESCGRFGPLSIIADDVLAAGRQHDRHAKTLTQRDYEMRVFENGSVYFRNTENPRLRRFYTLDDIRDASRDFWLAPNRALWQHIFHMWA